MEEIDMSSAVIYFSKSGTTATVAAHIANALEAPSEGIVRVESKSILSLFREIAQSLSGKQPNIQPLKLDVSAFDRIIIGSPVWAGNISSPVTSFLARYGGGIRSAAAFLTHGDSKKSYSEIFTQLETMLGKKLDATYSVSSHDVKTGAYDLSEFLAALRTE